MTGIAGVELKPSDPGPVKPVLAADVDDISSFAADNLVRMFANEHAKP